MLDSEKQLSITLTEPVVFLRTSDPSGRFQSDTNDSPTLVRGILALNVAKPIAISSIEVELSGMLAINYPEAIGSRRMDVADNHKIHFSIVTVFRAENTSRARHSVSAGPRLYTSNSNEDEHAATTSSRPPSLPRGRSERRSIASVPLDLGPTPPYTEVESPIQSRLGIPEDHPTQALQEMRQEMRDTTEDHEYGDSSTPLSSRSHIAFSLPNPMMRTDTSSTSNDSSHRESDNVSGDLVHMGSPPLEGDTSFHSSAEEPPHILPLRGPSPNPPFRPHSPESAHGIRPRSRGSSHDPTTTSNSRLRLSLTSVLDAVKEITSRTSRSRSTARLEERERGRSRVRTTAEEQNSASILEVGEGVGSPGNSSQLGPNASHGHSEHREHYLLGLCRILGLERDHEKEKDGEQKSKEHGESWREFKPGTYSFPISFLLPPHLPPTFSVPNGSLNYTIKGVAHRPGTFTPKLSCHVPLLVVAAPSIGAGEGPGDPGPLFVQQQWQGKLAYSLGLSSRLFLLGTKRRLEAAESVCANTESPATEAVYGTATLDLTLLPIEKVKIWRLGVFIDQRVRYFGERGRPFRDEDKKQVRLLDLHDTCPPEDMGLIDEEQTHKNKHKHKDELVQIPLLPTPISPHRSPLLPYLSPSIDSSTLAGPGPYTLSFNIGLPGCNDPSGGDSGPLHYTVRQKSSSVRVEHTLRLLMRVEQVGDEDSNDHKEGEKKKLFDIAVQSPITILSCRCVPEYQTLPRYSRFTEDSTEDHAMCVCQENIVGPSEPGHGHEVPNHFGHGMTHSSSSSLESEHGAADEHRNGHEHSRSPSRARRSSHTNPLTLSLHSHPPSPATWSSEAGWTRSPSQHAQTPSHDQGQHHHAHSQSYSVPTSHVHADSQTSPLASPHQSRPSSPVARYERLVSGMESEAGEAPPSYESVTSEP